MEVKFYLGIGDNTYLMENQSKYIKGTFYVDGYGSAERQVLIFNLDLDFTKVTKLGFANYMDYYVKEVHTYTDEEKEEGQQDEEIIYKQDYDMFCGYIKNANGKGSVIMTKLTDIELQNKMIEDLLEV